MKLGFSAKKDGFDCTKWHSTVDDKGKTLVIIKTTQNFIFGGFTKNGWISGSNGRYISDSDAFIFSLRNDKNDRESQKFTVKQGEEGNAIYYHSNFGPIFGFGHDLYLKSDLKTGCTDFGWAYDTPNGITYDTDEAQSYLAGSYDSWIVDEVETYFI
ncbi:pep-cterm sorting domain-containing protein [Anaeramoeba ignava]|uniref:Pep-cterm sorting domain-containing protein n=1 Tax=Anaeramoeba ignava TaxID=1746090 RepID=A0A9Q0L7T6_ANAIG|nr:pep-cterm sorting domain-containing protein [Anaeramoeba ignava]